AASAAPPASSAAAGIRRIEEVMLLLSGIDCAGLDESVRAPGGRAVRRQRRFPMTRSLCLALAVALAAAQPAKEKKPMIDQERLQGTWQLVSGERAGKPFPAEVVKNVRLVFAGNKLATHNQ